MQEEKTKHIERTHRPVNIDVELLPIIDKIISETKNEFGILIFKSRDAFIRRAILRFIEQVKTGGKAE